MNERFKIIDDNDFWNNLMFMLSGYFSNSDEKDLNGIWIDGFTPLDCINTMLGLDVLGSVSVCERQDAFHECKFMLSVPQKLLHKKLRILKLNCKL